MNNILRNFSVKTGLYLLVAVMALVATGCEKDHTDAVSPSEEAILLSSDSQVYPLTINATKGAWKAACTSNWLTLSTTEGVGTKQIELIALANTTSMSRTATIYVSMNNANAQIIVTQKGLSDSEVRISPELITAKPYAQNPYTFTLQVQNNVADPDKDITYTIQYLGDAANWIENVTYTDAPTTSYHLTRVFGFELEDNLMADAREAKIVVSVTYGHHIYTREVTIHQNGLGTPAVATPENVYLLHNQTNYVQTVWLNDGDQTNVTYRVVGSSAQSGTGTNPDITPVPWLTSAQIIKDATGSDCLQIIAQVNNTSETREGDIYIVASRGNNNDNFAATANLRVHVIQAAHLAAGISLPISEVAHNYTEATYTQAIQPLNNSTVTAVANATWISEVKVEGNRLSYKLAQFAGGQAGNCREAVITLTAANGNANKADYSLTVRQYAPEMPGISLPTSKVSHPYTNTAYTLPLQTINSSTVTAVSNAPDWITNVTVDGALLKYTLSEFAGGQAGNFREGVITLTATNDHNEKALYYVTVRQYAPEMPGISLPVSEIAHNYTEATYTQAIQPLNSSTITATANATWISEVKVEGNQLSYKLAQFAGGQAGNSREAIITLTATNSHSNKADYSLVVRQYAPEMPGISLPTSKVSHPYTNTAYTLPLQTINGATVTAVSNAPDWITNVTVDGTLLRYTLSEFAGGHAGNFREGVIMLTATNDHNEKALYYVTVCQYAPEMPGISMPVSEIAHNYTEATYMQAIQPLNNSTVTAVANATWISEVKVEGNQLSYKLAQFAGGQAGNSREAVITLTAANSHANKANYTLIVRQYAPEMPGLSMPTSKVSHPYTNTAYTLPLQTINSATVTAVSNAPDWITNVTVDGALLKYTLSEFAGSQAGNFREGVITLTATNDHNEKALYYVTVCQYAPEMPGISNAPEYIGLGGYDTTTSTLTLNPLNGSTITLVGSSAVWLAATITDNTLSYSATSNTGASATNYFREAIITLKATNKNSDAAYYYITVRQYARDMAYILTPNLNWSWYAQCNGSSSIIAYGRYSPEQGMGYIVPLRNVPHYTKITVSQTNTTHFATVSLNESNMQLFVIPSNWELGVPDKITTYSNTTYITIDGEPYVQTLTIEGTITVTSGHDAP